MAIGTDEFAFCDLIKDGSSGVTAQQRADIRNLRCAGKVVPGHRRRVEKATAVRRKVGQA
jgi:hypothetical protein